MYKDLITYQLAKNVTEEHLLAIAQRIAQDWMLNQKGFIKWEIHKNNDESYTDIVCWESEEDAKKAEVEMVNIPHAEEWFGCYLKDSILSKKLYRIGEFVKK